MRCAASRHLQTVAASLFILTLAACGGRGALDGTIPGAGAGANAQSLRGPLSMARSARKVQFLMKNGLGDQASRNGAGYPVTADPPVSHPNEAPCVDKLFDPHTPPLNPSGLPVGSLPITATTRSTTRRRQTVPGRTPKSSSRCTSSVSAGVQYDRTGAVWIGATNVFFGTTAKPGSNASPQWNVERDVTEYAPIFAQPSVGQASVYNIVNSQYTGVIYGTAELDFYPATKQFPAGDGCRRRLSAVGRPDRRLRVSRRSDRSDDRNVYLPNATSRPRISTSSSNRRAATSSGTRVSRTTSRRSSTTAATPDSAKAK